MKKKILLGLGILYGLLMLNAGLNKIFMYMPPPPDLPEKMKQLIAAFETIGWLMPLVAIVEIIGGILCMIPRFRVLGALMLLPILAGIVLTHSIQEPSGFPIAIICLAINTWFMVEDKHKLLPIIKE
ncbi:MAG: DoxX family protein [Cytophagaceae bacterium]|jgi:uncharacterized membrane protein YphA (DoxX/SURF4 family)|nr:DoxX family protein [Cytophagaceae bacterium]